METSIKMLGNAEGFRIEWIIPGFGFGQFDFVINHDGSLFIDDEHCGRERVMEVLSHLVKNATLPYSEKL